MSFAPPGELLDDAPAVCVHINKQWVSFVMGVVEAMTRHSFWTGSDEDTYGAEQESEKLMLALSEGSELCMVPIGTVIMYSGNGLPENWLFCSGQTIFEDDYPELFAVIGRTYGGNETFGTFATPAFPDRFPVAAANPGGGSYSLGETGGANSVALSVSELPAHSHELRSRTNAVSGVNARVMAAGAGTDAHTDTELEGGGVAHENRPPFIALHFIIRAR